LEVTPDSIEQFTLGAKTLAVERVGTNWRLIHEHRVVQTRDLSAGVDELLGRSRGNLNLVLRILEWDMDSRESSH
jgi:hypothetical protein